MNNPRKPARSSAPAPIPVPHAEVYPWQIRQWETLGRQRRLGRLPHALLLHGGPGLGKLDFTHALAAAALCRSPDDAGRACGQCRGCRLTRAGNHPDYRVIRPVGDGRLIRVESVREFIAWVGSTPQYQGPKVLVMQDAERMNTASANAFLKTLEEPPGDSLLLLVSAHPAGLPATIRSRCQRAHFAVPDAAVALPWLQSRLAGGSASADPRTLLGIAAGAPLAALELARSDALERRRQAFGELGELARGRADPLAVAAAWCKRDLTELLHWHLSWIQDMIRSTAGDPVPYLANPDLADALRQLARLQGLRALYAHLDRVVAALNGLAKANLNAQLVCEDLLIPWLSRPRTGSGNMA
jgi:DNA polymerase-3 subunit delta'